MSRDIAGLQEIIEAQRQNPDLAFAMVLDMQGLILAHTDAARRGQYVTDLPDQPLLSTLHSSHDLVDVISPSLLGGNHVGWVRIGISQQHVRDQSAAILRDGIFYTLAAVLIGVVIAALLATRLTRRLNAIATTAGAIMTGDGRQRVPIRGTDETALLARRFNEMLDVLEQREHELHGSYQRLMERDRLLDQSQAMAHVGSWELNVVAEQFTWSDETYRIFGLIPENTPVSYTTFLAAVHPDDRLQVNEVYSHTLRNGDDGYDITHRIVRRDNGEIRHIHEKCQHVRDASGKAIRSIGMVQDITDQVLAAQKLTANEMRLKATLKTAIDGIAIIDAEGTLVDASDSFLHSLGYDESWLGRLKVWDWDPHLSRDKIEKMIAAVIASGESSVFETRHRHRDGHEFWVEVHGGGVEILGKRMVFTSARDITERKQAEAERERLQEQLLQAQKMEAIGHLTGGIAHDFNNMLGAILGYTEMLKATLVATPGEPTAVYLDEIMTAGNRAKELIAQMMIFSRLHQADDAALAAATLLKPVLKEVISLLHSTIPSSISVNYRIEDDSLRAHIQAVQLHQILLNLVINARDAIGEYGRIEVTVGKRSLAGDCAACYQPFSGDYIMLSVQDTGKGIPADLRGKIFEPFFTTKGADKGTGMGLAVVHGMVHANGGHIMVNSELGVGTEICVLLPAAPALIADTSADAARNSVALTNELAGLRIMVVDDEVVIARVLKELLALRGASVETHTHPRDALAAFTRNPYAFDLVITDQTMPDLSGLDMALAMREIRSDLPVIMCTGYSEYVDKNIAKEQGLAGFMYKPVESRKLIALVREVCRKPPAG